MVAKCCKSPVHTLLKRASSLMRHIGVFSFVFAKLSLMSSFLKASLPPRDVTPLDATPAAVIDGVIGIPRGMDTGAGMAVLPVSSLFTLFVPVAANNHK